MQTTSTWFSRHADPAHWARQPACPVSLIASLQVSIVRSLGDFLQENGPFSETTGQFYVANVANGLFHLHSMDIVYRNVYPDSLLLSADGYVQLMDMSYAVRIETGNPPSDYCGAAHYLAPEQVAGQGHGKPVDYWALGILMYEMLLDRNPWLTGDDVKDTELGVYGRISDFHGPLEGTGLTPSAEAFVNDLLTPDPEQRLGVCGVGPEEIRAHSWMAKTDWYGLANKTIDAPHASLIASMKLSPAALDDKYSGEDQWCSNFGSFHKS